MSPCPVVLEPGPGFFWFSFFIFFIHSFLSLPAPNNQTWSSCPTISNSPVLLFSSRSCPHLSSTALIPQEKDHPRCLVQQRKNPLRPPSCCEACVCHPCGMTVNGTTAQDSLPQACNPHTGRVYSSFRYCLNISLFALLFGGRLLAYLHFVMLCGRVCIFGLLLFTCTHPRAQGPSPGPSSGQSPG
jgi:hypothetical protein